MKLNVWFSKEDPFTETIFNSLPMIQFTMMNCHADVIVFFDDWNPSYIEKLTLGGANVLVCTDSLGGISSYDLSWYGGYRVAWCKPELQSLTTLFAKYLQIKELMVELADTKKRACGA